MTAALDGRAPAHQMTASPPASTRLRVRPGVAIALIVIGAVAVIGLWWQHTPALSGLGDWLTNAGRITGLLASYAVVVLLGLMARVPALERGVGTDRMTRWHALGGRYTVSLVVAHALLITWGYAVSARTGVVTQGLAFLRGYGDIFLATVGGLLLVLVGVVSARAARRKMRYETWHLIHLLTYLAVALAFSHQFSAGAEFAGNRPAQLLWSALYALVGGLLVWYRILTPVRQAFRHRLRVSGTQIEGPGIVSVYLTGRHLEELNAEPGQFFRWRFLTKRRWWAANPYSLSAPVVGDGLRITVKELGDHSSTMASLRPGTRVAAEGPYGAFTEGLRRRRKVLLIGAGVGITPLRALFETLPANPGDLTLIYRASHPDDVVLGWELDRIAADRRAAVHYLVGSREQLGGDPLSADGLSRLVPHLRHHDVYLCGPAGMAAATIIQLRRAGVPRRHIHHESFEF
jgi:predicted ferric reductase